ncbi:MAG: hypothetical protein ACYTFA_10325 [Planctomycetota bacterium]
MCRSRYRVLISPTLLIAAAPSLLAVSTALPQQLASEQWGAADRPHGNAGEGVLPHEGPKHDPWMPGPGQIPEGPRSPAAIVERGPYVSVQVNVDARETGTQLVFWLHCPRAIFRT